MSGVCDDKQAEKPCSGDIHLIDTSLLALFKRETSKKETDWHEKKICKLLHVVKDSAEDNSEHLRSKVSEIIWTL